MLIFILLSLVSANRTISPIRKHLYEQIPHTKYSHNIDSTLLLQYNSFPGVYSMELGEIRDGKLIPMHPNKTLDPYTLNGCYPYERRLLYKHLLDQQINGDSFFTNMYIDNNYVYVTTNDNTLYTYQIDVNEQERTVKDIKLKQKENFYNISTSEHFIACHQQICLIFSPENSFIYKDNNFTQISIQPTNIYFDENSKTLYLTYNNNTIDIYTFSDIGELIKIITLNVGEHIVQVRTNIESTKLYILDKVQGLLIYKINSISEYVDTGYVVKLENGQAFDFYKNTFFIVAETTDGVPYAIEILLQESQYYFNKIYSKDMDIFDVWVGEHFAILIGSDVHRVIYHSIYNKFSNETEQPLFFQDIDLVNVEEFRMWNSSLYHIGAFDQEPFSKSAFQYKQSFMVGISSNQLSIFTIKSVSPWIQCKPQDTNSTQFYLKMNSTNCQSKQIENDYTAFKQCIIMHNFTVEGKQILFYEEDQNKIILIGCGLISVILLLIIGVVLSKKHFDDEIKKLSEHIKLDDQELASIPNENAIV